MGADLETTLSPTPMPQADVIMAALQAYQTEFKKPAITAYVLDFSGSMAGQGQDQMMAALEQVMIPEYASQHLLQGTDRDITYLVPFSDQTYDPLVAAGNDQALAQAYDQLEMLEPVGNTYLFEAVAHTLLLMEGQHGDSLQDYQPAIVVLTDGEANGGMDAQDALDLHDQLGRDIPVFSILFGSASEGQLNPLAEGTQARVFDGRSDLTSAFKAVKGYN